MLLALAPEELAEVVLQLAREHKQNNHIHLQSIASHIYGHPALNDGYPQNRRNEAEQALPLVHSVRVGGCLDSDGDFALEATR